jgi:RNA polymerase sigma factor for flagellar operon FliA
MYKMDKDQIVRNFLPKIKAIAINLLNTLPKSVDLDDLIQEGVIGLLQSYERYDPTQGATFYTYALTRIKGSMLDYLRKIDWLPKEIRHLIKKYEEFVYKHQDENFTDEEIAKELEVELTDIQKIKYSINKSQILELDNYLLNIGEDFIEAKEKNNENDPEISAYKEILENELKEQIKKS